MKNFCQEAFHIELKAKWVENQFSLNIAPKGSINKKKINIGTGYDLSLPLTEPTVTPFSDAYIRHQASPS